MRFVENAYVEAIRHNPDMEAYLKKHPFSWDSDYYMLKELLDKIKASEAYKEYMDEETTRFCP